MAEDRPATGATVIAKLKAAGAINFRQDDLAGFRDLMVKPYAEPRLFRVAYAFEQATQCT